MHPEGARAGRDELADAAEAEDPELLVVELDARELRALPATRGQRGVRLRDVARQREQQRQRVLGGGDDVRLRRVGDDDAPPRRRRRRRRCRRQRRRGRSRAAVRHARSAPRVSVVAERIRIPSKEPMRSASVSADQSKPVSTSKCSRSSASPDSPTSSRTSTRSAHASTLQQVVDAGGQRAHVVGFDRREHRDAQLVAPELAIGLDVDDPVRAQASPASAAASTDGVEVDRPHDQRAQPRVGHERRRHRAARPPIRRGGPRIRGCAPHTNPTRRSRASSRAARRAGRAWRWPACSRSARARSSRARWPATGKQGCSVPSPRSARRARARRGSAARARGRRRKRSSSAGRSSRRRPARHRAAARRRPRSRRSRSATRGIPAGRATSSITPVEVSLCAQASTSAPWLAVGSGGALPGSARHDDGIGEKRCRRA